MGYRFELKGTGYVVGFDSFLPVIGGFILSEK